MPTRAQLWPVAASLAVICALWSLLTRSLFAPLVLRVLFLAGAQEGLWPLGAEQGSPPVWEPCARCSLPLQALPGRRRQLGHDCGLLDSVPPHPLRNLVPGLAGRVLGPRSSLLKFEPIQTHPRCCSPVPSEFAGSYASVVVGWAL